MCVLMKGEIIYKIDDTSKSYVYLGNLKLLKVVMFPYRLALTFFLIFLKEKPYRFKQNYNLHTVPTVGI